MGRCEKGPLKARLLCTGWGARGARRTGSPRGPSGGCTHAWGCLPLPLSACAAGPGVGDDRVHPHLGGWRSLAPGPPQLQTASSRSCVSSAPAGLSRDEDAGRLHSAKKGNFHEIFNLTENERPLAGTYALSPWPGPAARPPRCWDPKAGTGHGGWGRAPWARGWSGQAHLWWAVWQQKGKQAWAGRLRRCGLCRV